MTNTDLPSQVKAQRARRRPYMPLYTTDWRDGMRGLTFEQQGFYAYLLTIMWERGGRIPADDLALSAMTGADRRMVRRLKAALIAAGKIELDGDQLVNPRMERERTVGQPSVALPAEVSEKSPRSLREVAGNVPENAAKSSLAHAYTKPSQAKEGKLESCSSLSSTRENRDRGPPAAAADRVDLIDLGRKLLEAGEGAVASPAACPGLMHVGAVVGWLEAGADLEIDVLPTIRAVSARHRGKPPIKAWAYFAGAVADAKSAREAGLPRVDPGARRSGEPSEAAARAARMMAAIEHLSAMEAARG